MLTAIKENLYHIPGCSSAAFERITDLTSCIRFKPNTVSKIMDTMHGGVLKHGGYHRLFGGHSIADFKMWSKHGIQFGKEIAKDYLSKNGVPIPGTETAVRKGVIKTSIAQKWGSMNVGDGIAAGVSAIDSAFNVHKFITDEEGFRNNASIIAFKGATKVIVSSFHGNIPLMALGAADIGMVAWSKLTETIQIDCEDAFAYCLS